MQTETKFFYSKSKQWKTFLKFVMFLLLVIIVANYYMIVGLFLILFFSIFINKSFKILFNYKPELTLSIAGISNYQKKLLSWKDIQNEEVITEHGKNRKPLYYLYFDCYGSTERLFLNDFNRDPLEVASILKNYRFAFENK